MALKYVSPTAGGGGDGNSVGSPWTVAQAQTGLNAGDTCYLRGGIYQGGLRPTKSGTPGNPITWKNYGPDQSLSAEVPIFDGSKNSANTLVAVPNPWTHVTGETSGWFPSPLADVDIGANVYRKSMSPAFTTAGVFVDSFDTESGTAAGALCILWDMGTYDMSTYHGQPPQGVVFGPNPDKRVHDGAYNFGGGSGRTHSDAFDQNGLQQHGATAQFKTNGGASVDIRIYGPTWDPALHKVYVTNRTFGLDFQGGNVQHYHIFDGIRWYRFKNNADLRGATNIIFRNCWLMYSWSHAIHIAEGSHNGRMENCKLFGGGSTSAHIEEVIEIHQSNDVVIQDCEIAWGGHGGIMCRVGSLRPIIRRNHIHDCAGSQITCDNNPQNGLIEDNIIHGGNRVAEVNNHKVPHAGIQFGSFTNFTVQRNLIYNVGKGILITGAVDCSGNVIRHNTIDNVDAAALELNQDTSVNNGIRNNRFVNNIFSNPATGSGFSGTPALICDLTGPNDDYTLSGNVWRNNLWFKSAVSNLIKQTRKPLNLPLRVFGPGNVSAAIAQSQFPASFNAGNLQTDPLYVDTVTYALQTGSPARNAASGDADQLFPDLGYKPFTAGGADTTPPIASLTSISPLIGTVPLIVTVQSTASDPSTPLNHRYVWGDGTPDGSAVGTAPASVPHTYTQVNSYTFSFTVTDGAGNISSPIQRTITVNPVGGGGGVLLTPAAFRVTSEEGGSTPHPGSRALDGVLLSVDPESYWAASPMPQSIEIDVTGQSGVQKAITAIDLYLKNFTTRQYHYDLHVSSVDDPQASDWTPLVLDAVSLNVELTPNALASVPARWVRVRGNSATDGTTWFSVGEIKIYGTDIAQGGGGQKYTGVTATATAEGAPFLASKTVDSKSASDSDYTSRWMATMPASLMHDLGAVKAVGRLRISFYKAQNGRVHEFSIDTSDENIPVATIWTNRIFHAFSSITEWTEIVLPAVVQARHVRLTLHSATGTTCGSVYEMETYAS